MDQLELLKKEWKDSKQEFPVLSFDEIYRMLLKKSSSIVKWIFIISLIEIAFWLALNFLVPESSKEINEQMGLDRSLLITNIIHFTIFAFFIVLFYRNHQAIQVTDSVKELMKKILKTRRTVRYFVYYNIGVGVVSMIAVNIYYYNNKEKLFELMKEAFASSGTQITLEQFTTMFFGTQIVVGALLIGFLALIYYLVYGLMLRRLKRNYVELKKMES